MSTPTVDRADWQQNQHYQIPLPQDDDELHAAVQLLWGVNIPRTPVCPDHCTPFQAFADAFFMRYPVILWKASRGFGGKSQTLALLGITGAAVFGCGITLLGGSAAQSQSVHNIMTEAWFSSRAPRFLLKQEPTVMETKLINRGSIRALMASQRSVRGPHPQWLLLDEIDEMDLPILEAAQGQPMSKRGIRQMTCMSSTHQYPDATMAEMLRRAVQKGWPVREWCYRETSNPIDGWLTQEMMDLKRAEVSEAMWRVEYDLQEPSIGDRAIDGDALARMFDAEEGSWAGLPDKQLIIRQPRAGRKYATGVDWAKEQDWTVISTWDTTQRPWQRVAWERTNKLPWPVMVRKVVDRLDRYPGPLAHDATGIGNVVGDMLTDLGVRLRHPVHDVVMVGREREAIFAEYVAAIEADELRSPMIEFVYKEHLYTRQIDLFGGYGSGSRSGRGHPPDSVVADALAWRVRTGIRPFALPMVDQFTRDSPWIIQ